MNLIEALNWRYATKQMTGAVVPQAKLDIILNATLLTPTSSGLQPFEVILISNKALREKILPIAHHQPQISQASHLMVFAAWDNYSPERVNEHFSYMNKKRNMPDSTTDDYRNMMLGLFATQTPEQHFQHAAKQAYIGLGFAMIAAATEEVDATPMEGFNPAALDVLLNLNDTGFKTTVILALGYRNAEKDWLVKLKKCENR